MTRILIADDERLATTALGFFLSDRGHEVRTADSGEAAVAAGQASPPEVLLVDYLLGGRMNGLDVARALLAVAPGLRVLVVTGLPVERVLRAGADIGTLEVIAKPFDLDAVAEAIEVRAPPRRAAASTPPPAR